MNLIEAIASDVANLVNIKNKAYGDSFGKCGEILEILYPGGVKKDQYKDVLAISRVIDKLSRIATNNDPHGEDPWRDIAGYALLAVANNSKE